MSEQGDQEVGPENQAVSNRKVQANRQNALKSTGPKTSRGKAFSRRNALTHGVFATDTANFLAHGEDRVEYAKLLKRLWDQYQPVGIAEELEVERITNCWWKFKRAWRYENGSNRAARRDFGGADRRRRERCNRELISAKRNVICQLLNAEKEIKEKGEVPNELKHAIFVHMPVLEWEWSGFEASAQRKMNDPASPEALRGASPKERASELAWYTAVLAICFLKAQCERSKLTDELLTELETAEYVIPCSDALNRLLRYEALVERNLNRALDRLERLQRRREGEPVLPPVSVRLTQ